MDDYLEKREWTLGTPEPKGFWERRKWRKARKCQNCNGRGTYCSVCNERGYYAAGQLYSDYRRLTPRP